VIKNVLGEPATAVPMISPFSTAKVAVPATAFQPLKSSPLNRFFHPSAFSCSPEEHEKRKILPRRARM